MSWDDIFRRQGRVFYNIHEDISYWIEIVRAQKAKQILDLGCGTGRHTIHLLKQGFVVDSMDTSPIALRILRKEAKTLDLKARTIRSSCYDRFPFQDDVFDAILAVQVIQHNFHDRIIRCISEIKRVLRPDGLIFITVPKNKHGRGSTRVKEVAPHTVVPLDGPERGLPHFIYSKKRLMTDLKAFELIDMHTDQENHYCIIARLR